MDISLLHIDSSPHQPLPGVRHPAGSPAGREQHEGTAGREPHHGAGAAAAPPAGAWPPRAWPCQEGGGGVRGGLPHLQGHHHAQGRHKYKEPTEVPCERPQFRVRSPGAAGTGEKGQFFFGTTLGFLLLQVTVCDTGQGEPCGQGLLGVQTQCRQRHSSHRLAASNVVLTTNITVTGRGI